MSISFIHLFIVLKIIIESRIHEHGRFVFCELLWLSNTENGHNSMGEGLDIDLTPPPIKKWGGGEKSLPWEDAWGGGGGGGGGERGFFI